MYRYDAPDPKEQSWKYENESGTPGGVPKTVKSITRNSKRGRGQDPSGLFLRLSAGRGETRRGDFSPSPFTLLPYDIRNIRGRVIFFFFVLFHIFTRRATATGAGETV